MGRYGEGAGEDHLEIANSAVSTANKKLVARWSIVDCDIDYMRVAINCADELTCLTFEVCGER